MESENIIMREMPLSVRLQGIEFADKTTAQVTFEIYHVDTDEPLAKIVVAQAIQYGVLDIKNALNYTDMVHGAASKLADDLAAMSQHLRREYRKMPSV